MKTLQPTNDTAGKPEIKSKKLAQSSPKWLKQLIKKRPLLAEKKIKAGNLELKSWLDFTGELNLEAVAKDATAETEPTLLLKAYTGKLMELNGWPYPVVIDLRGASYDKKVTPIIADHKTSMRVGHTVEQVIIRAGEKGKIGSEAIRGPFVGARGIRSSDMEIAKGIMGDLKRGFPMQVSIGAKVHAAVFVDEDESVEVNGRSFDGPIIVASRSSIRELSVLVLGADNDTSTVLAARLKGNIDMDFEAFLEDLGLVLAELSETQVTKYKQLWAGKASPVTLKKKRKKFVTAGGGDDDSDDDDDDDDDDNPPSRKKKKLKASRKADLDDDDNDDDDTALKARASKIADEEERVEGIREIAARFPEIEKITIGKKKDLTMAQARSHAIRERMSSDQFELLCRRASYPDLSEGGPAIHNAVKDVDAKALECAILRQAMIPESGINSKSQKKYGLEAMYDQKILEASHHKQYQINNSIENLMSLQIRAAGRNLGYLRGRSGDIMAEAHRAWGEIKASGFSTINVVNVLENVMHKAAYAAFVSVEGVWPLIARRKPLNDFKVHALYRLDYDGHFRKVAPDGELKHISMVDSKKTIQAETFGAMLTIDRKTRRNDDLGLVIEQARGFGSLGAQRIEEAVMVLLLSNPGSFFATGNGNLISGAGSALGISSLETAQLAFRNKVINGKPIAVGPSILLVGTNQEILSGRLWRETRTEIIGPEGSQMFTDNPFAGRFKPVVSGYLNNTSITDQDGHAISGQSDTQYFLLADKDAPQGAALVIGFLDGRETPYFDEEETQFNIPGGIQMRAYFDFGVAMHITQMALKSVGA